MHKLGICIVGCGEMGALHAEAYSELADPVELFFCSRSEKARVLAERFGGRKWFHDVDRAIACDGVDVVDICLPHHLHAPVAVESFQHGKHVITEKPIAMTLNEADEMLSAAEKAGKKFMVCENIGLHPHVLKLKECIETGRIGEPFFIQANAMQFWESSSLGWRADVGQSGGGILIDLGVHFVHALIYLGGNVKDVHARFSRAARKGEGEDTAILSLGFVRGAIGQLNVSLGVLGAPSLPVFVAYGTEGTLISDQEGLHVSAEGGDAERLIDRAWDALWWESVKTAAKDFVRCIREDREPVVTGAMGRADLEVVVAAHASAEGGRVVELPLR
jgi:predicted dehydrogenase